jgi:serine phosphatase RsbU (regulator of sigma subunit)
VQQPEALRKSSELGAALLAALIERHGMNDLLDAFLHAIGAALGVDRLVLYDYDESADVFELLYFRGYPASARSDLNRRLVAPDVRRACSEREPYRVGAAELFVPLYFQETLEAVLVADGVVDDPPGRDTVAAPPQVPFALQEVARLVSRFLGLFLSSNRLPMNQRHEALAASDLQRAREVQLAYLPANYPATEKYEIYGYNQSSALVGGDYFDYFCQRQGSIQCVVADACGHGMAAALIMSTFRGLLHVEVGSGDPHGICTRLNRQVYSGGEILQYLTAVLFEYEEASGTFHYFNAGHFDPLIVRPDGSSAQLPGGGPPLGMFRDSTYQRSSDRVAPGDLLVLFTDGLVELRNPQDEFFGLEGIRRAVVRSRTLPLPELAGAVLGQAASFSESRPPDDDLTLFLMRFR